VRITFPERPPGWLWFALAVLGLAIAGLAVHSFRYEPVEFVLQAPRVEPPCRLGAATSEGLRERLPGTPSSGGFCLVFDRWRGVAVFRSAP
jgi:hypothetical protein